MTNSTPSPKVQPRLFARSVPSGAPAVLAPAFRDEQKLLDQLGRPTVSSYQAKGESSSA